MLEIATFDIKNGNQEAFELAFGQAKLVISKSKGFLDLELQRCLEISTKYVLFVNWGTLEDHTIGFRGSPLFLEWRSILSPHFQNPPVAEHFQLVEKL